MSGYWRRGLFAGSFPGTGLLSMRIWRLRAVEGCDLSLPRYSGVEESRLFRGHLGLYHGPETNETTGISTLRRQGL